MRRWAHGVTLFGRRTISERWPCGTCQGALSTSQAPGSQEPFFCLLSRLSAPAVRASGALARITPGTFGMAAPVLRVCPRVTPFGSSPVLGCRSHLLWLLPVWILVSLEKTGAFPSACPCCLSQRQWAELSPIRIWVWKTGFLCFGNLS